MGVMGAQYHACHCLGHIAKYCTKYRHRKDAEAPGISQESNCSHLVTNAATLSDKQLKEELEVGQRTGDN